jgi:hypothetical protein
MCFFWIVTRFPVPSWWLTSSSSSRAVSSMMPMPSSVTGL